MKILMVCLGNICRSPLAEGILRSKIEQKNLDIIVDSAGTGGWHVGQKPDTRSIEVAKKYNIDISNQRARQFTNTDFQEFDIIYAMDGSNLSNIASMASSDKELNKVKLILNETNSLNNEDVPDPYYGGEDGFENVFQLLNQACDSIINKIQ